MKIKVGILSGNPHAYTAIRSHTPDDNSIENALEWAFKQQQFIYARCVQVVITVDAEVVLNARRLDGAWASC